MKRVVFLLFSLFLAGCTYQGKPLHEYLEDPRSIIQDPHFTEYKAKRDNLEHLYLTDQISYVDYVKQIDDLDNTYTKEVKERNAKLQDQTDQGILKDETLR